MPTQPQKRKINPLAIVAVILLVLAAGMLFLIFAPGPRMKWALSMGEKYLTEWAYSHPMFVEDVARKAAQLAAAHPDITWFSVAVESFESIHAHSAFALVDSESMGELV